MKVCALVMAAGKGRRMGAKLNKVFLSLKGKPIICYSIETMIKAGIKDIFVVVSREDMEYCNDLLRDYGVNLVKGGLERQNSVYNGINALKDIDCDIVVIHDAARPFVTCDMINESIDAAEKFGASGVGVKVKDTIKIVKDGYIESTLDRDQLWAIQTPQTFKLDLIAKAHENALKDDFKSTDDTALVERMGIRVKMINGTYRNIKITTPEDIKLAEMLCSD